MHIDTSHFTSPEAEYQGLESLVRAAIQTRMDEIAHDLDRTYGAKRTAERLGVTTTVVNRRRNRHKERTIKTVTVRDHRGNRDITRTWTRATVHRHDGLADDTWQTQAGGRTWLLVSVEEKGRRHWALKWRPAEGADTDTKLRAMEMVAHLHRTADQDRALADATLYLDQHPQGEEPPAPEPLPTTHTVTEYVPVAKQEISRTWQRRGDVWETLVSDVRCVLYRTGGTWVWSGPDVAPITPQHSAERAMKEVTWHLDVQPLIHAMAPITADQARALYRDWDQAATIDRTDVDPISKADVFAAIDSYIEADGEVDADGEPVGEGWQVIADQLNG